MGREKVHLQPTKGRPPSSPAKKGDSSVAVVRYGGVAAVRPKGPIELEHSLAGTGSTAASPAEAEMFVQLTKTKPDSMESGPQDTVAHAG